MSRFENRTLDRKLDEYIQDARTLLLPNSPMMLELLSKDDFKYNSGKGYDIHQKIVKFSEVVPVFLYKPFNPFTSAMGYSDGKSIHINKRKIGTMARTDLIGLLLHELMHQIGFNHGTGRTRNYKTEDKCLFSVPYFISSNVHRWL